jgi:hypothetical protein
MSVDSDIDRYLRERGLLSVIDVARRHGAEIAGLQELERRMPGLSSEAYARLLGQGLRAVEAARDLAEMGSMSAQQYRRLPAQSSSGMGQVTLDIIVEIDPHDGGPPRYVTVHVPAGQSIDLTDLDQIVYAEASDDADRYGIDISSATISYEPVGVYVA